MRKICGLLIILCMLIQIISVFSVYGDTLDLNMSGIEEKSEETISENYLKNVPVVEFAPAVGNIENGYSQLTGTIKEIGTILTDGLKNKADGNAKWYVKFPQKGKVVPYTVFNLESTKKVNTVKIFAGTTDTPQSKDRLIMDEVYLSTKKGDGAWEKVTLSTENCIEMQDAENKCQVLLLRFENRDIDGIKLEFAKGSGIGTGTNVTGFRLREIELYYDGNIDISVSKPDLDPEPETGIPWQGIYDYNVNNNAIFNLSKNKISVSSGDIPAPDALVDGKRESANGGGATKWFVEKPSGEEYVEFDLEKEVGISKAVVCSGPPQSGGNRDTLESFEVQYMDSEGRWVTAASVRDNSELIAEVGFDPIFSNKFRIFTDTRTRFRIREIQLEYPDLVCSIHIDKYIDMKETIATVTMNGSLDEAERVEVFIDEAKNEFPGGKSEYSLEFTPSQRGFHSIKAIVYDTEGKIISKATGSFTAVVIYENMENFAADKESGLREMIEDLGLIGFNTDQMEYIGEGVYRELPKMLGSYTSDLAGMEALCGDIDDSMPKALMNGAENGEELLKGLYMYEDTYKINLENLTKLGEKDAIGICEQIIKNRGEGFSDYSELNFALLDACALKVYNITYSQSLPQVFEEYQYVCEIKTDYIEKKYLAATLSRLKTKKVENYRELPTLLKDAYNEVRNEDAKHNGSVITGGGGGSSINTRNNNSVAFQVPETPAQPSIVSPGVVFNDLSEVEWAREAIESLAEKGVLNGDGKGNMRPNDEITRSEFIKILVMSLGLLDKNAECYFDDVEKNDWYYRYVASAFGQGLINGNDENCFCGDDEISREDMAVIIYRTCLLKNIVFTKNENVFWDEDSISDYAKTAVNYLRSIDLVNGMDDNIFAPKKNTSRAECAVLIYRFESICAQEEK